MAGDCERQKTRQQNCRHFSEKLILKRKLKIAVLATVTDFGGAEKVVLSLINGVNAELYELVPLIFSVPGKTGNPFLQHLHASGKTCCIITLDKYKMKYLNPPANFIEAYRLFKKNKFDLVHTHGYRADVLGVILSKITGTPVISTCHGFISTDAHLKLYNKLDRMVLRYADRVMAVSEEIKINLMRNGLKDSRIEVVQNAVLINQNKEQCARNRQEKRRLLEISRTETLIGYVGRLTEEKGVKYLIEAFALLNQQYDQAKLLIIGDGPQRKELQTLAGQARIGKKVIFAGFMTDIDSWLPALDIFVLPSLTEGTPMALLEAMSHGIPVIASAVGGVPEVIASETNGFLVPAGNPGQIMNAIRRVCENEILRKSISGKARETISAEYDTTKWIRKIEAQYLNTALSVQEQILHRVH
jgi:glycosyltransferase involved in cell wall biosynthesis